VQSGADEFAAVAGCCCAGPSRRTDQGCVVLRNTSVAVF
jgi:hypothetical protein